MELIKILKYLKVLMHTTINNFNMLTMHRHVTRSPQRVLINSENLQPFGYMLVKLQQLLTI